MSSRQSPTTSKSKCPSRDEQDQTCSKKKNDEMQRRLEEELATSSKLVSPSSGSPSRSKASKHTRVGSACDESHSQHMSSGKSPASYHTSNLRLPSPPQHSPSSYVTCDEGPSQRVSPTRSPATQASSRRISPSSHQNPSPFSECDDPQSQRMSPGRPAMQQTSSRRTPSPSHYSSAHYSECEEPQRISPGRSAMNQSSSRRTPSPSHYSSAHYNECEEPQRISPGRSPTNQSGSRRTPSPHYTSSQYSKFEEPQSQRMSSSGRSATNQSGSRRTPSPSHYSSAHYSESEEPQSQRMSSSGRSMQQTSSRRTPSPSHYSSAHYSESEEPQSRRMSPGRSPAFSQAGSSRRLVLPPSTNASSRTMISRVSQKTAESAQTRVDYSNPTEGAAPFCSNTDGDNLISPGAEDNYNNNDQIALENDVHMGQQNEQQNVPELRNETSPPGYFGTSDANRSPFGRPSSRPPSRHVSAEHASLPVPSRNLFSVDISPIEKVCCNPITMDSNKARSACKGEASKSGGTRFADKPGRPCESNNLSIPHYSGMYAGEKCARELFPTEHHSSQHSSYGSPMARVLREENTSGISPITPSPHHHSHHGHDAGENPEVMFQDKKAEEALAHLSQLKQSPQKKILKATQPHDAVAPCGASPKGKPRLPEIPCLDQEEIDELVKNEKQDVDFANYLTTEARKTYKKPCPKQQKAQMNVKSLIKAYSGASCEEKYYTPLEHPDPDDISPEVAANMMFTQEKGVKMDACPKETVAHLFPSDKSGLRVPRSTISIVDPTQRDQEVMMEKSASVPSDGVSDSAYTRKMKEKGEEGSNQRSFDEEAGSSPSKREYVLVAEKPQRFNKIQFRGGNLPAWFPGYYSAFPDEGGSVKRISSLNGVLLKAWAQTNPKNMPPNDVIVLD